MCKFMSIDSDGKGKPYYFDWELRKKCLSGKLSYEPDSHTSIADYFGFKGIKEDTLNKYEYNPLTKEFTIDQLNTTDDSERIKKFCQELDFKKIVPQLIIKPIVHPFKDRDAKCVTKADLKLLKKWASVWDSVWDSVGASVGDSVGASVGDSVGGYTSDFFLIDQWKYIKHKKGQNPYKSLIDLWEKGLVPSYDGSKWRLHAKSGILWEGKI